MHLEELPMSLKIVNVRIFVVCKLTKGTRLLAAFVVCGVSAKDV